ncbi:hypothetical protein Fmac_001810 [Flemingia macrophylla]|uniref:Uncharacterized protein n=1 Tax=Flemingia macrophylla TaxID=520843 RepID=A0ABD1NKZ4_9FABA
MAVFFPMRIYYVAVNDFADFEIDKCSCRYPILFRIQNGKESTSRDSRKQARRYPKILEGKTKKNILIPYHINKPYLPMASGEYSFGTVAVITASSLILSSSILRSHTIPIRLLSMMRWKRSSMLTAMNYVVDRAIVFPLGLFLHMQDIPDIEGDEKFGIQTLAVRLGQKQINNDQLYKTILQSE